MVLSGTGSDGTLGLGAIRAGGGLALAQDPATAEYDGMPRTAIDAGMVDQVLAVAAMPNTLASYLQHPYCAALRGRTQRRESSTRPGRRVGTDLQRS